ncbi:hypothetical protein D3C81_2304070 [compost metagenome]
MSEGKHLFRALKSFDLSMADALDLALQSLYLKGDPVPLEALILSTLAPYGGILLDGFEQ